MPSTLAPDTLPVALPSLNNTNLAAVDEFLADIPYSQNVRFEHISIEEGLSQSAVRSIFQDRQGFLWVGTEDGLNRYDGYEFKIFRPNPDDPYSVSDGWITAITEDPDGYLWIGTRLGGLNRYDPQTGLFHRFNNDETDENSLSDNHVTALAVDKDGLWIGTETGLDYFDFKQASFRHYRSETGPGDASISALLLDREGLLWIGTLYGGLYSYDQADGPFRSYRHDAKNPNSLSHDRVLSLGEDNNGDIWIGAINGANRFQKNAGMFTRYMRYREIKETINEPTADPEKPSLIETTRLEEIEGSIGGEIVFSILRDRSGGLWFGTNNGLDRYDPQLDVFIHHRHSPTVDNSLSANIIYAMYQDREGIIWIGSYNSGLNKYNRRWDMFEYYRHQPDNPNSPGSNPVSAILTDSNGMVWIGSPETGLEKFDPSLRQFTHYRYDPTNPDSIGSDEILSLALDKTGALWIGTSRGLDRYNSETDAFLHYEAAPIGGTSTNEPVYSIFQDTDGTLWVGSNRGLTRFDPISQKIIPYRSYTLYLGNAFAGEVTAIFEDKDQNLWVGSFENGLKKIHQGNWQVTHYRNDLADPNSLGNDSILCIIQGRDNTIWIGTSGGGLNRYEPEEDAFTRFTEKNGLPNNVVYGIVEDDDGNLWLSTNFGLSLFDPQTEKFKNFTAGDGLQSNEFSQNSYARDAQGNIYFGGINGFNVFSPKKFKDNPYVSPIVLTSITQGGKPIYPDKPPESLKEITLSWPQNSFEFEFASLAFGQPNKNKYAYRLDSYDTIWNESDNHRNGKYVNLPSGSYTLQLRGSNSDGLWNEGLSIKVTIIPPYWESQWFRGALLAVFAIAIIGGYRWRVKSVESRARELERLIQKRTADLNKRTREMEALYQADEKILRNVTLDQVYQTLIDVSVDLLNTDRSLVLAWDQDEKYLSPCVSHGFMDKTLKAMRFTKYDALIGRVLETGEPLIVPNLDLSEIRPDVREAIQKEGIQSFIHLPLKVEDRVVAIFNVGFMRANVVNEDVARLYSALAQRASLSIANMQLFEQTKDLAVLEERNRLARDLHDSAKQKAFAALAQLGTANGMLKIKPDHIELHLKEAETLVYEVIQELTFLIQEIYPVALQEKGFPTTLREYIFEWENRNDMDVHLSIRNERSLPLEKEQAIYRVIQEALANVARHSRAKRVTVSVVYNDDTLQALISDDGIGFDLNQKAKGMGFRSMNDRVNSIHGAIQFQSAPGQGTRVVVQIPI